MPLAVVSQLQKAMFWVHKCGVVHADVKPGNVLVRCEDHRVQLVDFNMSEIVAVNPHEWQPRHRVYTTAYYRAPELWGTDLSCEELRLALTAAVDMWSYGCVVAEMALGKPLFHAETLKGVDALVTRWTTRQFHRQLMINNVRAKVFDNLKESDAMLQKTRPWHSGSSRDFLLGN